MVTDEPKPLNMAITRMEDFIVVGDDASTLFCAVDTSWRDLIASGVRNGLVEDEMVRLRRIWRDGM